MSRNSRRRKKRSGAAGRQGQMPTNKPADKADKNGETQSPVRKNAGGGWEEIVEGVISAILLGVGKLLDEISPNWALAVTGVGLLCLIHLIKRRCHKRFGENVWFGRTALVLSVTILVVVGLIALQRLHPEPKPGPQLRFCVSSARDPQVTTDLTNDFLSLASGSGVRGAMVVPMGKNDPKVVLRFKLFNVSAITAEHVDFLVSIPEHVEPSFAPEWKTAETESFFLEKSDSIFPEVTNRLVQRVVSWPAINPTNGIILPDIEFNPKWREKGIPISLRAQGKDLPAMRSSFVLFFESNVEFKGPKVFLGSMRPDGQYSIQF